MNWVRSSRCDNSACVEVSWPGEDHVLVRDSKNPRMVLRIDRPDWDVFLAGVRAGDFDQQPK